MPSGKGKRAGSGSIADAGTSSPGGSRPAMCRAAGGGQTTVPSGAELAPLHPAGLGAGRATSVIGFLDFTLRLRHDFARFRLIATAHSGEGIVAITQPTAKRGPETLRGSLRTVGKAGFRTTEDTKNTKLEKGRRESMRVTGCARGSDPTTIGLGFLCVPCVLRGSQ